MMRSSTLYLAHLFKYSDYMFIWLAKSLANHSQLLSPNVSMFQKLLASLVKYRTLRIGISQFDDQKE